MNERSASVIEELRSRYGTRVSTSESILDQHGRGESYNPSAPPDAVFFAESTEEVAHVVGACAAAEVPVIPFGAGTSLEGHVGALRGGISIDLTGMNEGARGQQLQTSTAASKPGLTRSPWRSASRRRASSSLSTRAQTRRSAAWPRRVRR